MILQINTQKFFQGQVRNHTPTLMSYNDNIVSVLPSTSTATPTHCERLAHAQLENFVLTVPELPSFLEGDTLATTHQVFEDIIKNFSTLTHFRQPELEFQFPVTKYPSYEELALADFSPQQTLQEPEPTNFLMDVMPGIYDSYRFHFFLLIFLDIFALFHSMLSFHVLL